LSGSIREPSEELLQRHTWLQFADPVSVPIVRLDSFLEENDIPYVDLIYADVQGAEVDLIQGGAKAFARQQVGLLFTEYSNAELYRGQTDLDGILGLLPSGSRIVQRWQFDVLIELPGCRR